MSNISKINGFQITAESASYAATASLLLGSVTSASFADTASYINPLQQNVSITGSLNVSGSITASSANINNLYVTDLTAITSSIQYITSSQLNVGTNIITLNTNTSPLRFGGLAVADSGSSPIVSGSLLFDSVNDQWIFIHQQNAGSPVTSSVLIMGPQTFNDVGNEITIGTNRLTKGQAGDLGEHITSSNISDDGTIVSINSNTEVTGSLTVTQGITGSLFGTATTASFVTTAQTASFVTLAQTASLALTASFITSSEVYGPYGSNSIVSSSYALTASYAMNSTPGTSGTDFGKVIAITQTMYPFSGF